MRVYMVEDEPQVAASLIRLLQPEGHDVTHFDRAETFFERLPDLSAGAVIMNILLPGIDGLTAARMLRTKGHNWPIVLITGSMDIDAVNVARDMPDVKLLSKPFDPNELIDFVDQASSVQD